MKKFIISTRYNRLIFLTFFLVCLSSNNIQAADLSFISSLKWGYSEAEFKAAIKGNFKKISRKDHGSGEYSIDIIDGGGFGFGGSFRHNKLAAIYIVQLIHGFDSNAVVANNYVHSVIKGIAYNNGSKVNIGKKGKYNKYTTLIGETECIGYINDIKGNKILGPNPVMAYIIYEDINNIGKYSKNTSKNKTNRKIIIEDTKISEIKNNKNNVKSKSESNNLLSKDINKDLLIITKELENLKM